MKELLKVLGYARNLWPYYLAVVFFSLLMSLTSIAQPFIAKNATDVVVGSVARHSADVSGALFWVSMFLLMDVLNTVFVNWGGYLGDVMSARLRKQLSERYYTHLLKLPQSFYDKELTGAIINRLNRTIADVTQFMNMFANNFFQMLLQVAMVLVVLLFYSWELAVLIFVVYPLFMWLTTKTSKKWQRWQTEKNSETDIASGRFAEVISQIRVVKSFVQEALEFRHFERRFQKTVDLTSQQSSYWHKMDVGRRLVMGVLFFFVYAFVFIGTAQGRFSISELVMLIQLVGMARLPIYSMSFIVDNTQRAVSGSHDYFKIMELRPDISDKSHAPELTVTDGLVQYENVSFGYSEEEPVLKHVTFNVLPGEKVALVGQSGEGKSTVANLLMRLYKLKSGSIKIDGTDISSVRQTSLRENIAAVFQEPALFSGTIRENIAYAKPHATETEIVAAARAANAHEFVGKLEKGFDTEIGERGLKLSGGQKQRIAIARAILKDSPLLILDEATSSLDNKAERLVQEALERLMKGRTTLIIAHRLSTIAHVDKIVTLKNGHVDEVGTPEELARTDGIYAELLSLQDADSAKTKQRLKSFEIDV